MNAEALVIFAAAEQWPSRAAAQEDEGRMGKPTGLDGLDRAADRDKARFQRLLPHLKATSVEGGGVPEHFVATARTAECLCCGDRCRISGVAVTTGIWRRNDSTVWRVSQGPG